MDDAGPALFSRPRKKRTRGELEGRSDRVVDASAPEQHAVVARAPPGGGVGGALGSRADFASLGLSPWLVRALSAMALRAPTAVQVACIPPVLAGRDALGCAQTGSGKTAAFALPILQRLGEDPWGIAAVVLTPARELAAQIGEQFAVFGAPIYVRVAVVTGGQDLVRQGAELSRQPHVLVATPGRLAHVLSSGSAPPDLSRVAFLVLDECDRLAAESFSLDLDAVLRALPPGRGAGGTRATLLFSATPSPAALAIPRLGLHAAPFAFDAGGAFAAGDAGGAGGGGLLARPLTVSSLAQYYLFIPAALKNAYLVHALLTLGPADLQVHADATRRAAAASAAKARDAKAAKRAAARIAVSGAASAAAGAAGGEDDAPRARSVIVFVSSCMSCALVAELCVEMGVPCAALHSVQPQAARTGALAKFRGSLVRVLIATDVASRGLDLPAVDLVLNYDVPRAPDDYVHRVGRTARAGRAGRALTLVTQYETELLQTIEARALAGARLPELPRGAIEEADVLARLTKVATALELAKSRLVDSGFKDALGTARRRKHEARAERAAAAATAAAAAAAAAKR